MNILRDYQEQCLGAIFREWERVRATAAIVATGLGKTTIFANAIKRFGKRTLVIAHRKELIEQAAKRIYQDAGLECDIEMGLQMADAELWVRKPVVIATVQTLNSGKEKLRLEKWKPDEFGLIVCDEFHHGTSNTYRRVFSYFKDSKILGVTATPDRADEEALSQVCDSVAFTYDILDGCNDGWLVPVTQQFCPVSSLDFSEVRTVAGELNEGDLARIMEARENVEGIVHPTIEVLYGLEPKTLTSKPISQWRDYLSSLGHEARRTIIFTVSVLQAQETCNLLNHIVPGLAEWVCGKTDTDDRQAMLERFAKGKTKVMVNCGVLTEGYDNPAVEVIVMARPTMSRSLYTQMVGRSTRPLPGLVDAFSTAQERKSVIAASDKKRCRIIDFVGNSGRHKLICAIDILAGKCSHEVVEATIKRAKAQVEPVTVLRQLSNSEIILEQEKKKAREAEAQRKARLVPKAQFQMQDVDPFGNRQKTLWKPREAPAGPPATPKQRTLLGRCGIYPHGWTKKQAGMVIGILAQNHWRLPVGSKYDWIRHHGKQAA